MPVGTAEKLCPSTGSHNDQSRPVHANSLNDLLRSPPLTLTQALVVTASRMPLPLLPRPEPPAGRTDRKALGRGGTTTSSSPSPDHKDPAHACASPASTAAALDPRHRRPSPAVGEDHSPLDQAWRPASPPSGTRRPRLRRRPRRSRGSTRHDIRPWRPAKGAGAAYPAALRARGEHSPVPRLRRHNAIAYDDPEQIRICARILGHSRFSTTEGHYTFAKTVAAADHYHDPIPRRQKRRAVP
jgi:hypothetical protein